MENDFSFLKTKNYSSMARSRNPKRNGFLCHRKLSKYTWRKTTLLSVLPLNVCILIVIYVFRYVWKERYLHTLCGLYVVCNALKGILYICSWCDSHVINHVTEIKVDSKYEAGKKSRNRKIRIRAVCFTEKQRNHFSVKHMHRKRGWCNGCVFVDIVWCGNDFCLFWRERFRHPMLSNQPKYILLRVGCCVGNHTMNCFFWHV